MKTISEIEKYLGEHLISIEKNTVNHRWIAKGKHRNNTCSIGKETKKKALLELYKFLIQEGIITL